MNKKEDIKLIVDKPCGLLDFLNLKLNFMPNKKIKAFLTHRAVVVNGKIHTHFNYQLKTGQTVLIDLYNRYDFLQTNNIQLLYEDDELLVVNKPNGMLSVDEDAQTLNTAYTLLTEYVGLRGKDNRIYIVHRLDKEASGVFLVVKSRELMQLFQNNWNNLMQERLYYAAVEGVLEEKQGSVTAYLMKDKNGRMYAGKYRDGEKSITDYKVVRENSRYSLLDVAIHTGKKNQIRVCMRDLGHPIIGDNKYDSKINPIKRMGLHAYKLTFTHPENREVMSFTAKLPKEFNYLFKLNKGQ